VLKVSTLQEKWHAKSLLSNMFSSQTNEFPNTFVGADHIRSVLALQLKASLKRTLVIVGNSTLCTAESS